MDTYRKKDGFENEKLLILPRDVVLMMSRQPLTKNLYITDIGFFPHAQYHYIERFERMLYPRRNTRLLCK